MISLKSNPDRIFEGETLKIELIISGKINEKTYYGKYLNLNIIKNGTTDIITLYPLRYNFKPLEWEVNPNSYKSYGTFNVQAIIQDGPVITTTTFIVEEKCIIGKINTCNNINYFQNINNSNNFNKQNKKTDIIETLKPSIQKPNTIITEKIINKNDILHKNMSILLNNKVQKTGLNVNPN